MCYNYWHRKDIRQMSKNSSKTPLKTSDSGTQVDTLRKSRLKVYLKQQEALYRICQSKDYQEFLKPILQAAFHNKWLDPAQQDKEGKLLFQTLEQFHRAY